MTDEDLSKIRQAIKEEVTDKLVVLDNKIGILALKVDHLSTQVGELNGRVNNLENKVDKLSEKVDILWEQTVELTNSDTTIKDTLWSHSKVLKQIINRMNQDGNNMQRLDQRIEVVETQLGIA